MKSHPRIPPTGVRLTTPDRETIYISLHQTHLPRLDKADVLNYESTREEIELTETGEDLRVYMDVVQGNDIPWSEFYLGLSAFSAALLMIAWLDYFPFSVGPDAAYALGVVALFTLTSVVHVLRDRRNRLGGDGDPPTRGRDGRDPLLCVSLSPSRSGRAPRAGGGEQHQRARGGDHVLAVDPVVI